MIKGAVAVPKYAAWLALVPPQEDVGEINPDDVFVYHGGWFLQTEQFGALHGNNDKDQRYKVMGWTRESAMLKVV